MLQMPLKEIIEKICKESGLSEKEVKAQIKQKMSGLDELVSEEGAAYIVAHDLNVELFKSLDSPEIKIKDVLAGMRNVDILGQVTRVFEPRTYEKDGKTNQVGSFIIGDETGTIRIVIWDQRVRWLTNGKIVEGNSVRIKGGYVKSSQYSGGKEVHLSSRSQILLDVKDVVSVKSESGEQQPVSSAKISALEPGQRSKIAGTIVRAFLPNFYDSCPECRKKVVAENDKAICREHGDVEAKPAMVLSFIIDDGTGSIRCTAFQDTAERIVGMNSSEAQTLKENQVIFQEKIDENLLGTEIEVEGTVRDNKAYERIEFIVNQAHNQNPLLIAKRLLRGD